MIASKTHVHLLSDRGKSIWIICCTKLQGKQSLVPGGGSRGERMFLSMLSSFRRLSMVRLELTQTGLAPPITEQGTGLAGHADVTTTGL